MEDLSIENEHETKTVAVDSDCVLYHYHHSPD
jgi:hypothetical protein